MKVDYESQADKLHLDLVVADEEPIGIDLEEVSTHGTDAPLRAAAEKYGLDPSELVAAGRVAYLTPDRTITLEFDEVG